MENTEFFGQYAQPLLRNGYEPLPVTPGTKAVRVTDWQKIEVSEAQIKRWLAQGKSTHGIGLRTRNTPAIDIDVLDAEVSSALAAMFAAELGAAPSRVGRAPKCLLLCRTDEPFRKLRREFADRNGEIHAIEILGDGQQFVAYGIHPDTGKPFSWGLDEPAYTPVSDLPLLTAERAAELLEKAAEVVNRFGWHDLGLSASKAQKTWADDDPLANYQPPPNLSDDEVDGYLSDLPNDTDTSYDVWLTVGMALWHQYQGSPEGFERWVSWSEKSPKHNDGDMAYKWDSFNDSGKGNATTFRTVIKWVNDARKKNAVIAHGDLVKRIEVANDRSVLDSVKRDMAVMELDLESRDDLINRLRKAYSRLGLDVSKSTLVKAANAEKKAAAQRIDIGDLENALSRRVLDDHYAGGAHLMRYAGQYWRYVGGVWRPEDAEQVDGAIKDTLTAMKESGDEDYKSLLVATREQGRDDRMSALVGSVSRVLMLDARVKDTVDPLNLRGVSRGMVINCRNGELWFNDRGDMKFRKHDPAHRLTTQIAADYDPAADCPEFKSALATIFQRCREPEEVIRHWLEMMGILLQPTRPQAFWLLMKGAGGNGKSFLMEIIAEILGPDSCYAGSVADLPGRGGTGNNHFTASLLGKLMFLDDDLQSGILLPDGWVKKLSEEKLMTANPKGAKTFEFISRATLVALSNSWPSTADISGGMRRRAQVIEMNYAIPHAKQDTRLAARVIRNELPGVLNLLVDGFRRFVKRGCKLLTPPECVASQERWLCSANPTARFIHDVLDRTPGQGNLPAHLVYEEYKAWVYESGERVSALGRNGFYNNLTAEGVEIKTYKGCRWVASVSFRQWREGEVDGVFDPIDDDETGL